MKGKQAIIDSILDDARQKAEQVIAEATQKADGVLADAQSQIDGEKLRLEAFAKTRAEEILSRKISVAELETKKYRLSLKQKLMGDCFDEARARLLALSDKEYLGIIEGLLKYAEDGDKVVVCKNDVGRITADFVKKAAKGKKVALSDEVGDFCGGIILTQTGYDKNMTFDVLLQQVREESEAEIAAVLFGEN